MSNIDAQTLMAYFDGELAASDRQYVEQALEENPELQEQLQQICHLDSLLGVAYSDAMHGQQPPLRAFDSVGHATSFKSWLLSGLNGLWNWQVGAAAALLLLGVTAGGWYERQSQQTEFAFNQQQIEQAIDKALETYMSGESFQWTNTKAGRSGSITPVRTYKSDQGQYCREFIQKQSEAGHINQQRAIACRSEKGWQLKASYYL